jgi:hypothetical protein
MQGDVVGMTGAHEACIAQELGLAYASVCVVDNLCNGLEAAGEAALSPEGFAAAQAHNVALAEQVARVVAAALPGFVGAGATTGKGSGTGMRAPESHCRTDALSPWSLVFVTVAALSPLTTVARTADGFFLCMATTSCVPCTCQVQARASLSPKWFMRGRACVLW